MKLIKSGTISRSKIHHKKIFKDATPRPTQKDFDKMYDDIETRGQIRPVAVDEKWNLVDGYTRDEILGKQRIDNIKYDQWEFESVEEKLEFIDSMNRKRRHLTEYQKFLNSLPTYEKEKEEAAKREKAGTLAPKGSRGKATSKAAKEADMSTTTYERALTIHKRATPEQEQEVIKGKKAIKTLEVQLTRKDRNERKYPLPKTISDVFLGDLPYQYGDQGGKAAADEHYDTIPTPQLMKDFSTISAADNSISFTWWSPSFQYSEVPVYYDVPDSKLKIKVMIPAYKAILDAGGFKVINEFVWDKERMGVGSYNRNQHENLLIAVKGKMPVPAELFPSVIRELRTAHSRKPNLWPMIKKMYPKRNYAELYARVKTPGVLYHGNQITVKTKERSPIA